MGKLILYGITISPPVRTVLLTLNELKLEFEFKDVDVLNGEQYSEEYLKKNPQHTVPLLEDDGDFIWDSHAIICYLVRKYGSNDSLYPKDFFERAVVDQRLHYESEMLFACCLKGLRIQQVTYDEKMANIEQAFDELELLLVKEYMAGDHLTIADFSILASVSSLERFVPVNSSSKRPKLSSWIERMKNLPYYEEANGKGVKDLAEKFTPAIIRSMSVF